MTRGGDTPLASRFASVSRAPRGAFVLSPMPLEESLISRTSSREVGTVYSSQDLPELLNSSGDESSDSNSNEDDLPEKKNIRSKKPHRLSRKSVARFEKGHMEISDSETDKGEFEDPPRRQKDNIRR